MSLAAGKQLFRLQQRYMKAANRTFGQSFKDLQLAMADVNKDIVSFYNKIIDGFDVDKTTGGIKPILFNNARISVSKNQAERMARGFLKLLNRTIRQGRKDFLGESGEKDKGYRDILKKVDLELTKKDIKSRVKQLQGSLTEDMERNIAVFLDKWVNYYPHIMRQAMTSNMSPAKLREMLILPNGNIKVGSSLEEAVAKESAMDLLKQRTAATLVEAKELGLGHCWNANPMDRLTKPQCARATIAGVIPIKEMEEVHGFPPREICRCDLMIVDGGWTELNQGINRTIEERRLAVLTELMEKSPRQKTKWWVQGYTKADGTVVKGYWAEVDAEKFPGRASGQQHYAATKTKWLAWNEHHVPPYKGPGVPPIPPVVPPAEVKAAGLAKDVDELRERFEAVGISRLVAGEGFDEGSEEFLEAGNKILLQFEELIEKYPGLKRQLEKPEMIGHPSTITLFNANSVPGEGGGVVGSYKFGHIKLAAGKELLEEPADLIIGNKTFEVAEDLLGGLRHELGHDVEGSLFPYWTAAKEEGGVPIFATAKEERISGAWKDLWEDKGPDWFKVNVSGYASASIGEAFAESFCAFTSPLYGQEFRLPIEIEAILEDLLG